MSVLNGIYLDTYKKIQTLYFSIVTSVVILFNSFIPEFLRRTLPALNLDVSTAINRSFSLNTKIEWQTV